MFVIPITEFFTQRRQVPDKYKYSDDWESELMEAKFLKKKRSNARGSQWSYGLDFKDGKPLSYYQDIWEWKLHYVGIDLHHNPDDSDLDSLPDETEEVDPPGGSGAAGSSGPAQDPDEVIAEAGSDDSDQDEDPDPEGKEPPEMDEKTPMDTRLASLTWKDVGIVEEDCRLPAHNPDNFTPSARMPHGELQCLLD